MLLREPVSVLLEFDLLTRAEDIREFPEDLSVVLGLDVGEDEDGVLDQAFQDTLHCSLTSVQIRLDGCTDDQLQRVDQIFDFDRSNLMHSEMIPRTVNSAPGRSLFT